MDRGAWLGGRLRGIWERLLSPRLARLGLWRGKGLILLADDDDALRPLLALLLTRSGYAVIEAADGMEAARLLARHGRRLTALIADLVMPGLDGEELILRARVEFPGLPGLLITGRPDELERRRRLGHPLLPCLLKPFCAEELVSRIRSRLEEPGHRP